MNKDTRIFEIDEENIDQKYIDEAAFVIKNGGTVVFPTETVYGIGADPFNKEAVLEIYKAKGRPSDNPLIVHISDLDMLTGIIESKSKYFDILSEKFWPGPLTMIMKKADDFPGIVTANLSTVAVRFPSDKIALALIEAAGPICAPSANISGRPSATTFEHVYEDLFGKVDIIIKSKNSIGGLESTVIDLSGDDLLILRPGMITAEDISNVLGIEIGVDTAKLEAPPRSPGMKYRHYAPKANMYIYSGEYPKVSKAILEDIERLSVKHRTGILAYMPRKEYEGFDYKVLSQNGSLDEVSKNLFALLRDFDKEGFEYILAEAVPVLGIGEAVMNRLIKASSNQIKYI